MQNSLGGHSRGRGQHGHGSGARHLTIEGARHERLVHGAAVSLPQVNSPHQAASR